ncbi:MAG TPA: elongation factor P [Candidatus Polarisedimenticolaceae bacterium]|nr:elongation factor P [Candidatus Polarisedimenticolaceae bacterium]
MKANHLRRGMVIKFENDLWSVFEATHQTPGNLRARMQTKLKNLRTGTMKDVRFRSEDEVEKAHLELARKQYLYRDPDGFHFMDVDNYEQFVISDETLGDAVHYMQADMVLQVLMHEGQPVGVELPATVDLQVVETTPEVKGATASAQRKPAKLETGLVVQVPAFVAEGERIRVRTEDGQYVERA